MKYSFSPTATFSSSHLFTNFLLVCVLYFALVLCAACNLFALYSSPIIIATKWGTVKVVATPKQQLIKMAEPLTNPWRPTYGKNSEMTT
jgi:hypothetical protein